MAALRESGREMTVAELAEATGGAADQIAKAVANARAAGEPVERVRRGVYRYVREKASGGPEGPPPRTTYRE